MLDCNGLMRACQGYYNKSCCGCSSAAERFLAKEEAEGATPFTRSPSEFRSGVMAEWLRRGLQIPVRGFDSPSRLRNMAKHKKKFLLPSDRAELLKAIERGDIIERTEVRDQPTQPLPQKTHESTSLSGEPAPHQQTADTETTGRELRRILATAIVLIVLLGCLTIIQIKTPYINQLAEKIGTVLSI